MYKQIKVEKTNIVSHGARAFMATFPNGSTHRLWTSRDSDEENQEDEIKEFAERIWRKINES